MDVLLDCDFAVAEKNRLYRCLDHILPHKDALCEHLKTQWETMFDLEYDILLYDLTSTYFEGMCQGIPKAKFGHSKDRRSDCRQIYKEMIYRDGTYFLRTNQAGKGAVELWQQYILQTNVEQAFKELKSDLCIRPIRHHLEERVEAHVFIAFLSYCLQVTLRRKLRHSAPGLTSRAALEILAKIKMLDVYIPTTDDRTIHLQRYTQPEMEHKILLDKLNMTLPKQAPPKIYSNQCKN